MKESIFANSKTLDANYLEEMYSVDLSIASVIFEQYLKFLSENMEELRESFAIYNIDTFRKIIHKLIPTLTYVGLAKVSNRFLQLQETCFTEEDMQRNDVEIRDLIHTIDSTTDEVQIVLKRLKS